MRLWRRRTEEEAPYGFSSQEEMLDFYRRCEQLVQSGAAGPVETAPEPARSEPAATAPVPAAPETLSLVRPAVVLDPAAAATSETVEKLLGRIISDTAPDDGARVYRMPAPAPPDDDLDQTADLQSP